jgi:hypothetical protein
MAYLRGFGPISLASLLAACSQGTLDLTGRDLADGDLSVNTISLTNGKPVAAPEWGDPDFDHYGVWVGQAREIFLMPRVGGRRAVRLVDHGLWSDSSLSGDPEAVDTNRDESEVECSSRFEYEVADVKDCGEGRACLELRLVAQSSSIDNLSACYGPEAPTLEVVDLWSEGQLVYRAFNDSDATLPRYRVAASSWRTLPTKKAPPALRDGWAWSDGERAVVFGIGADDGKLTGGVYTAATNTWSAVSSTAAPTLAGAAAWAGSGKQLFVYTGSAGFAYDISTDAWTALETSASPAFAADGSTAVSIRATVGDGKLFVWGTRMRAGAPESVGGVYDIAAKTWRAMNGVGAPSATRYDGLYWTGTKLLTWSPEASGRAAYYPDGGGTWVPLPATEDSGSAEDFDVDELVDQGSGVILRHRYDIRSSDDGSYGDQFLRLDLDQARWESDYSASYVRRGSSAAGHPAGWIASVGGFTGLLNEEPAFVDGAYLDLVTSTPRPAWIPGVKSDALKIVRPLTTWIGDQLFVWGGCVKPLADGRCVSWSKSGRILAPFLGVR